MKNSKSSVSSIGDRWWFNIDSTHLSSFCGSDEGGRLDDALSGEVPFWIHSLPKQHWMVLDLGNSYNIHAIRCRSKSYKDPVDVQFYVTDDSPDGWGDPVGSWWNEFAGTMDWVERSVTQKIGRYIKLVINKTTAGPNSAMIFGVAENIPFFDVCVSKYSSSSESSSSDAFKK